MDDEQNKKATARSPKEILQLYERLPLRDWFAMLEDLLLKFAAELEINLPQPNKEKQYLVNINKNIVLSFKEAEGQIYINSNLCPCPDENREELFGYVMKANLIGQGTGGAIIALDSSGKSLTLSLILPYEINYRVFKEKIEDFSNYLIYWREEVEKFKLKAKQKLY